MAFEREIELLGSVPFLKGISAEAIKLVAFSAEVRDVPDREFLFSKGEDAESGLVVMSGRVDLVDDSRVPTVVKDRVGAGALLGELALIIETQRPVSAIAVGPTRVMAIRRTLFKRMLVEYPEFGRILHARVAERLGQLAPELARLGDAFGALGRK